jgi:hypothetical protein
MSLKIDINQGVRFLFNLSNKSNILQFFLFTNPDCCYVAHRDLAFPEKLFVYLAEKCKKMGKARRHKGILSTFFTLVFAVFTFYQPIYSKNVADKSSNACKTLKCSKNIFNGGEFVHSLNHFFVKKQHLDKIVTNEQSFTCILFQKKYKTVGFYSSRTNFSILKLNCILRI